MPMKRSKKETIQKAQEDNRMQSKSLERYGNMRLGIRATWWYSMAHIFRRVNDIISKVSPGIHLVVFRSFAAWASWVGHRDPNHGYQFIIIQRALFRYLQALSMESWTQIANEDGSMINNETATQYYEKAIRYQTDSLHMIENNWQTMSNGERETETEIKDRK